MTKQTIADLTRGFGGYDYDNSFIIIYFKYSEKRLCNWNDACNLCYTVDKFEVHELEAFNGIVLVVWN